MQAKLYDSVDFKGSNIPQRAYACTNPMEFFAELSVAYLWGQQQYSCLPQQQEEDCVEPHLRQNAVYEDDGALLYNKW